MPQMMPINWLISFFIFIFIFMIFNIMNYFMKLTSFEKKKNYKTLLKKKLIWKW